MLTSVRGIYRQGKDELYEEITGLDNVEVIVTFITPTDVNLRARGIGREEAAQLREQLITFEEDWNAPGMEAYDKL